MSTEEIVAILEQTPHRLRELTDGVSRSQLHVSVAGEWAVIEILAHLRACADKWGEAIEIIATTDHPTIRAVNPTTWIKSTDYTELEFGGSLRAFAKQRARLLGLLAELPPSAWSRTATVVGAGTPLELSVHTYANRMARHERSHWRQVAKAVATLR